MDDYTLSSVDGPHSEVTPADLVSHMSGGSRGHPKGAAVRQGPHPRKPGYDVAALAGVSPGTWLGRPSNDHQSSPDTPLFYLPSRVKMLNRFISV